jgi:hypothetical protein
MPEWLMQLLAIIGASASVYGAIRADLASTREIASHARDAAAAAHRRIDDHLNQGREP